MLPFAYDLQPSITLFQGNIPTQHTRDLMHSKMASIKLIDTA